MAGIAGLLVLMTMLVLVISGIWVVVQAFREHFLWGLGVVFIPIVGLVFVVLNWDKSGRPFLLGLAATGALMTEAIVAGGFASLFGG